MIWIFFFPSNTATFLVLTGSLSDPFVVCWVFGYTATEFRVRTLCQRCCDVNLAVRKHLGRFR